MGKCRCSAIDGGTKALEIYARHTHANDGVVVVLLDAIGSLEHITNAQQEFLQMYSPILKLETHTTTSVFIQFLPEKYLL